MFFMLPNYEVQHVTMYVKNDKFASAVQKSVSCCVFKIEGYQPEHVDGEAC